MSRETQLEYILQPRKKQFRKLPIETQNFVSDSFQLNKYSRKEYKKKKVKIYITNKFEHSLLVVEFMQNKKYFRCFTGDASHAIKCCHISETENVFIKNGVSRKIIDDFKTVHYADGTTDGSGTCILCSTDVKNNFPKEYASSCKLLKRMQKELTHFALLDINSKDKHKTITIDGIIHINNGEITSTTTDKMLKYLSKKNKTQYGLSMCGFINCQKYGTKHNYKYKTQFKIHKIKDKITEINKFAKNKMGKEAKENGEKHEILWTKKLNINKDNFFDKIDEITKEIANTTFFMHIVNCHNSKDHKHKIHPKSDIVIIQTSDTNIFSLLKEFEGYLSEKNLKTYGINYKIIPNAGISVKHNGVTLQRNTRDVFMTIYGLSPEVCAIASFYCLKQEDLICNLHIWRQWCGDKPFPFDINDLSLTHKMVKKAKKIIEDKINETEFKERILTGKGATDELYVSKYMIWDDALKKIDINRFHLTFNNASGKRKNSIPIIPGCKSSFNMM